MSMATSERAELAPVMQGGVLANAEYDERSYRLAVADSRARGNTAYPGVAMPENTGFYPGEIAWMRAGAGQNAAKMSVRTTVNGEAGPASRLAPNNPTLLKEAMRASMKLAGVNRTPVTAAQAATLGVTLQVAGLTQLRQMNMGRRILPGDKLMAVPPEPGAAGLSHAATPGAPIRSRYLLDVQPVDQHGAATRLFTHVTQALADPNQYREIMGGPSTPATRNADMWLSASKSLVDSYLVAGTLQLAELIDAGLVAPTVDFQAAINAQTAADGYATTTTGQKAAVVLAARLLLIQAADGSDPQAGLDGAGRTAYAQLRNRLARVALTSEGDRAHSFAVFTGRPNGKQLPGASAGANKKAADLELTRASESESGKLRGNLYGALRTEQYNHARRAIAAFHAALLEQDRFKLAIATSGTTKSGNVHAMLQMV